MPGRSRRVACNSTVYAAAESLGRGAQIVVAQKRVKKEDSNKAYVPRSFSEGKYQMGKCWGLSTSVPKKVNPLPKVSSLCPLAPPSRPCLLSGCPPASSYHNVFRVVCALVLRGKYNW